MNGEEGKMKNPDTETQIIVFSLNEEDFAIEINQIREIIRYQKIIDQFMRQTWIIFHETYELVGYPHHVILMKISDDISRVHSQPDTRLLRSH